MKQQRNELKTDVSDVSNKKRKEKEKKEKEKEKKKLSHGGTSDMCKNGGSTDRLSS